MSGLLAHIGLLMESPSGGGSTVTFVAATQAAVTTAGITANLPTGTADGDLLIFIQMNGNTARTLIGAPAALTTTPDFTISVDSSIRIWEHVASSEPANYTFTLNSGNQQNLIILAYRGATSIDTYGTPITGVNGGTTVACPSITPSVGGALIAFSASEGSSSLVPTGVSGMTQRALADQSSAHLAASDLIPGAAGATGIKTYNWTGATLSTAVGMLLHIS